MLSNLSIVISGLALLLSGSVYPCNIVILGGYKPTTVREGELSGTVVGSGRIGLMGKTHDEERRSIAVTGATIRVQGTVNGVAIAAKFHREDQTRFLLLTKGFHWINEYPDYR